MKTWHNVVLDISVLLVGAGLIVLGVLCDSEAALLSGNGLLFGLAGARIGQKSEAAKNGNTGPKSGAVVGLVLGSASLIPMARKRGK